MLIQIRPPLSIICLSFLIAVLGLQSVLGNGAPTSESQFLKEFETALKAKDTNAILSLFNWQGVSAEMKSFSGEMVAEMLKRDVNSVKLSPLPAGFQPTNELDGVRYTPNVSIVGVIDVEFTEHGNAMQLPYGKKGDAFYFTGTTEERVATPATKEKSLNVIVMGSASAEADAFTGSYVYVKGGKEIKEDDGGKGNRTVFFWGDYVKSCTVQKTCDSQEWIQLVVSEDGTNVFKSERVETREPIVYERK
jgi:hypothetical protein